MKTLRIGSGAGYSGDRIEPAVELAEQGDLDYLVFECLAERTIALAQQARISDPQGGYDPLLSERMRRVLPFVGEQAGRRRLRVITNMGAANPVSAAGLLCGACQTHRPAFDHTLVAADYALPVDQLVLQLKFGHRLALAPLCAGLLRDAVQSQADYALPALLCPTAGQVALHAGPRSQRCVSWLRNRTMP